MSLCLSGRCNRLEEFFFITNDIRIFPVYGFLSFACSSMEFSAIRIQAKKAIHYVVHTLLGNGTSIFGEIRARIPRPHYGFVGSEVVDVTERKRCLFGRYPQNTF
jgi:hypothetical protein